MADCEVGWSKEELEGFSVKTEEFGHRFFLLSSWVNPTEMLGY